jgi:DNA-binding IscR family transcriptional regulator
VGGGWVAARRLRSIAVDDVIRVVHSTFVVCHDSGVRGGGKCPDEERST